MVCGGECSGDGSDDVAAGAVDVSSDECGEVV